jgi:plastocyanin
MTPGPPRMRELTVLLALGALLPLAACGGDDDTGDSTPAEAAVKITAAADGNFAFEETKVTTNAGSTTFEFENPASVKHDVCLERNGAKVSCSPVITEDTTFGTVELEAGKYTYYCSVDGHREAGMEGTLTVKEKERG